MVTRTGRTARRRPLDHLDFWHAYFGPRRHLVELVLALGDEDAAALVDLLEDKITPLGPDDLAAKAVTHDPA